MPDVADVLAVAVIVLVLVVALQAGIISHLLHPKDLTPVRIRLEIDMAEIVEGGSLPFSVVGLNKRGKTVPVTGVVVVATGGSATVGDDGSGGVFVAADPGAATLAANSGALADSVGITVTEDNTATSIKIVV